MSTTNVSPFFSFSDKRRCLFHRSLVSFRLNTSMLLFYRYPAVLNVSQQIYLWEPKYKWTFRYDGQTELTLFRWRCKIIVFNITFIDLEKLPGVTWPGYTLIPLKSLHHRLPYVKAECRPTLCWLAAYCFSETWDVYISTLKWKRKKKKKIHW